ncbi:unnamed protein product, partial [Pylaiella littoralis]
PLALKLDGNGHRVSSVNGDSFFLVEGGISVTFFNMTFQAFHATEARDEVMNGVVISADDPASSLNITDCTFEGSWSEETEEIRGVGGAVYATGSLSIENSTFSENNFLSGDYYDTPTFPAGNFSTPSPLAAGNSAAGNFSTPSPLAAGNSTAGNVSTPSPLAAGNSTAGNFSTPSPLAAGNSTAGNFSTPSPLAAGNSTAGNFSTPSPLAAGNSTAGNFSTPSPLAVGNSTAGNFSTPSPLAAGNSTAGNFSTPSPLAAGNSTAGNFSTPSPLGTGNFSTPSPIATGNVTSGNVTASNATATNISTAGHETRLLATTSATEPSAQLPSGDSTYKTDSSSSGTYFSDPGGRTGAAVYWNNSAMDPTKTLNITGCKFWMNSVDGFLGGAVVARGGAVEISDTLFQENTASVGASLLVQMANLTLKDTEFFGNFANEFGGAIVQLDAGYLDVQNTTFDSNTAIFGGGAVAIASVSDADRYNLENCDFSLNNAGDMGGGAVYFMGEANEHGILTLASPTFAANTATNNGGIVSIACGNVVIESEFASEYENDENAFMIQEGFENCSSLVFVSLGAVVEPGPELISARISDTGTSVLLTFDQDTDYGEVTKVGGSFECSLLLDYPGVSGEDACSWTSAASITATLHYNASVAPLDSISALPYKVALSSSNASLNPESSIIIQAPDNPPEPQLVPEVWYTALAHCKDLVLDVSASTGAGGRVMKSYLWELYDWSVEQASDAPSTELEYVAAASASGKSSNLTIPAADRGSVNETTWFFNVTAMNWLGGVGWKSIEVRVSASSKDPPLLSLSGGAERTTLRAGKLFIFADAEVENCVTANKTTGLTYEWSELRTDGTFASTSADPSMFKLPPYSLEVGTTYEFRVDVTDSVGYSSFATQVVTVESSPLIAAVAGGNSTVSRAAEVVLDLTATVDPDEEDGVCRDCLYNVSCTGTLSGSACDLTLPTGETSDGVLIFQPEELVSGETYTLQASLGRQLWISSRRTTGSTWSTTSTFFAVGREMPVPLLSVTPFSVEKVNADAVVVIEAEMTLSEDSGAKAVWTLTDGVLDGYDDLSLAASSSLEYTSSGAGIISANMVLSANALVVGSRYTFSLTATYILDGRRRLQDTDAASASISLLVNTPPSGGFFEVSPAAGFALTDVFKLATYAWEDDVSDLPLTYVFAYVGGSADETDTSSEMVVRAALESAIATDVYLPEGFGTNSTLFASVYATDALGAASRATFGVEVSAYEGGVDDLGDVMEDVATEAQAAGDTDTVMQVLDVASSALNAANCSAAPDCQAFNRDDCGTDGLREDNTCGECMSGTVGVLGPQNSLCVDMDALESSCSDGEKNGDETDVDCGGSSCARCPSGYKCLVDSDCTYNNCPEPTSATDDQICISPAKACPNGCGGATRGSCEYFSSTSGAALNATNCLADTPTSTCRASCACFDSYGGEGCQYSDAQLAAAVKVRQQSLSFIQASAKNLDVSRDSISRQAVLLSKLSVVPEEMAASSVDLVQQLAEDTTRLADESGDGVSDTAASAMIEIVGQITLSSSYLGAESNITGLSNIVGSLIAAQVSGKVVGESADEVSSDYFRLSTGIYDAATVGTIQISPPLTAADEIIGRSVPSIGLPSEVGDAFTDVSSMSLAVAEWIIDPRQTGNATASNDSNEVVSSVVRFYADPIESSRRRLETLDGTSTVSREERWRGRRRSLLEDLGSLKIIIPNTVSQPWDPQEIITFTHECDWGSTETLSSTCPNGTDIITVCTGAALTREVNCSNSGTEPECASWQGSNPFSSTKTCEVFSFNESWTTCICSYSATVGSAADGSGSNQVDFASTLLDTPGEFISIWAGVTTLTLADVQSAAPVFSTMGGIIALAIIGAGLGWRFDQKDRGRPAGGKDWLTAIVYPALCCCGWRRSDAPMENSDSQPRNQTMRRMSDVRSLSTPKPTEGGMTRDEKLKALAAAVQGTKKGGAKIETTDPHHLGQRRVKMNLKLLIMVHHDFVSVFYCFYEWFTRPQRVALLLCTVITLMAAEATVFATIMFKDDGTCGTFINLADCAASAVDNVQVAGVGSSCEWDEGSRTCYVPEPEQDMETSLVISTISLILTLPLEIVIVAVFAAFIVRPTKGAKKDTGESEGGRSGGDKTASAASAKDAGEAVPVRKSGDHEDANGDLDARLIAELAFARAAEYERGGKMTRTWRVLTCGGGLCGGAARREARLVKNVTKAMGPAIELEEKMAQANDSKAQASLLFERAEADSLTALERQVFFKSRILNYGDEDQLSGVFWFFKFVAWLVVVVYTLGMSFYVCLFAVKAGRATSVQWMISFWVAFVEDIIFLIPLKLAFVYLLLPSLMRHRMRPDMFTRIPKHATSVQVARRHPEMQVSELILQGRIPAGNDFEKFVPLYNAVSSWYTCMTGVVFTTLAIIIILPDTLQAMVLDVLIAVIVGGGILGLAKLFSTALWGFAIFFVTVLMIAIVLCKNHKRT